MDDPTTADTGDGDSPIVDMGAYELSCETYHLTGDMDCDCDVDFDDVDPSSWR